LKLQIVAKAGAIFFRDAASKKKGGAAQDLWVS